MPPTDDQLISEIRAHGAELDKRARKFDQLEDYYTGECPLPTSIVRAQVTEAYRMLMAFSQTNYGRLIVKAATSRMEVGGIRSSDKNADAAAWALWQANQMDGESRLGHDTAITHGRVFAIVWPDKAGIPQITLEDPKTVIVAYEPGSRYARASALRRWENAEKVPHATLYTRDALYKFAGPKDAGVSGDIKWQRRVVPDEPWPLPNTSGVVPAVEIATNRRLKATRYAHAAGDFEHVIGLLDRINVLEFLRLVIAFSAGFPIRVVIGDKILRDDNHDPIAPFKLAADLIAQLENPNAKVTELREADLKGFGDAIDHDVETLAGITQTPSYYLRSVPIQNVSADAIRASDAPLNARVDDHKPHLAEGWEEVLRTAGRFQTSSYAGFDLSQSAGVVWASKELRSLSERADAATKLASIPNLPWQAVAEIALDATQEQISRWEAMGAGSAALNGLLGPEPPAVNGNGAAAVVR